MPSDNKLRSLILTLVILAIAGCISIAATTSPSYTGLTTQARINDQQSAAALGTEVLSSAVDNTATAGTIVGVQRASTASLLSLMRQVLQTALNYGTNSNTATLTGVSQIVYLPCGGSDTLNITTSGNVASGTIAFDNARVGTADSYGNCLLASSYVLNGTVNVTMTFTTSGGTNTVTAAGISFSALTVTYDSGTTQTLAGGETVNISAQQRTLSVVYQNSGGVYWLDNFQITTDTYGRMLTAVGRFYDPAYGYVDVATPNAFSYTQGCNNNQPDAGTLTLSGLDTSGNSYTVGLQLTGCGAYTLTGPYQSSSPDFSYSGTY